jgi:hypothetical protein
MNEVNNRREDLTGQPDIQSLTITLAGDVLFVEEDWRE